MRGAFSGAGHLMKCILTDWEGGGGDRETLPAPSPLHQLTYDNIPLQQNYKARRFAPFRVTETCSWCALRSTLTSLLRFVFTLALKAGNGEEPFELCSDSTCIRASEVMEGFISGFHPNIRAFHSLRVWKHLNSDLANSLDMFNVC